jgi:copper resistance protein B
VRTKNDDHRLIDGAHGAPCGGVICVLMLLCQAASAQQSMPSVDSIEEDREASWTYLVRLNKFEHQQSTRDSEAHAEWGGFVVLETDPHALWLTSKGATTEGSTESAEVRLFYSYTIAPHIGVQLGWKRDIEPKPARDWLGFGLIGVLPFKIGADASLFVGESDSLAARLEFAYVYWITNKLSLTPDIEANFYQNAYPQTVVDSTSSDLDLGLRLRYWVTGSLAPYVGITWKGDFNKPGDTNENLREDSSDTRLLLGISAWF